MAARRRPRKSPQGQLEDDLLKNQRWSGLKEQQRLQALRHTPQQNAADQEACRALVQGGWGTDAEFVAWLELCGQK